LVVTAPRGGYVDGHQLDVGGIGARSLDPVVNDAPYSGIAQKPRRGPTRMAVDERYDGDLEQQREAGVVLAQGTAIGSTPQPEQIMRARQRKKSAPRHSCAPGNSPNGIAAWEPAIFASHSIEKGAGQNAGRPKHHGHAADSGFWPDTCDSQKKFLIPKAQRMATRPAATVQTLPKRCLESENRGALRNEVLPEAKTEEHFVTKCSPK